VLTRPADDGSVELVRAVDSEGTALDWLAEPFRRLGRTEGALTQLRAAMDRGDALLVEEVTVDSFADHLGLDLDGSVRRDDAISLLLVPWARGSVARGGVVVIRRLGERPPFSERDRLLVQQVVDRHADAFVARVEQVELVRTDRFRELAAGAPFGLLHLDGHGRCTYANETWSSLVDLGSDDPAGDGWATTLGDAARLRLLARWSGIGPGEPPVTDGVWVATRTGSRRWLALAASGEHDDRGRRTGTVVMAGDDTARRAAEERLERLAHQDPLTGLANRRRLFETLAGSLRALDSGGSVAVVFVDLDYFKEVNDALGHDAGDRLLVELARRLRRVARPGELVARVGGDEFVLVLDVAGPEDAEVRVESLMRSLDDRVESGGLRLAINVSVGVATIGPEDADLSADEVIQRADAAMYVAKTSGRNRWAAYDDDMRRRDRLRGEVWQLLEDSLRDGRVAVVFQPVVDLATGRIVGAEALARIRDALPYLLTPDAFLDIAEETGLIVPLGEVVVAEACARLAEWTRIDPDFVVTVNLSGRQLAHPGAARAVLGSLESAGVDPARLCVEITESVLIEVVGDLAESVQELRRAGVQLALDDFGTGYSSLSRIRDFPIDVIKVDRSFVVGAVDDPIDAAIVAAVVQLAASLDLLVVAEGIEDRAQLDAVQRLGCAQGQGFHFGTPMDAGALTALVGTAFVADP
jgi:diguanylate cyclase (GGDEF)-like protein/PAS domain S-box-containing protein